MLFFKGEGLLNSVISNLPFELHLPGNYQYCGPGTRLKERLERGDPGINLLDKACKEHDIAYSKHKDLTNRHIADKILQEAAWERVKSEDAGLGEKTSAWFVTNAMKVKRKLGAGHCSSSPRRRRARKTRGAKRGGKLPFMKLIRNMSREIGSAGGKEALKIARQYVKKAGGRKKISVPRIIPLPKKTGGILPLLPLIFGGLSALGTIVGGSSAVVKAVNDAKSKSKMLDEAVRHNKTMEAISLGKKGSGLYLKKHRGGLGLYVKHQKN